MGDAVSGDPEIEAGDFAAWVEGMRVALGGRAAAEVPCAGCTACCTASQFVHIGPDETDTLAHIPSELLFPAPQMPGHVLMGYDERGHCPMLVDGACSIYDHRPRTCRTYDCRVFPAAGIAPEGREKRLIARRAARWRFSHPAEADRAHHDAVRAAARYVREHPGLLVGEGRPDETQEAVLAVELHEAFLTGVGLRIEPLGDHPELVGRIARWLWDEWGATDDPDGSADSWAADLAGRLNRDAIPICWVALAASEPVGSVSLVTHDMDVHRDLTPWLSGLFVVPEWRSRGIARLLTEACESAAAGLGAAELYLYTYGLEAYYRRSGWRLLREDVRRGQQISIMGKRLPQSGVRSGGTR